MKFTNLKCFMRSTAYIHMNNLNSYLHTKYYHHPTKFTCAPFPMVVMTVLILSQLDLPIIELYINGTI